MRNKVSIVIPFYTNFDWLEDAIASVFSQSYKNYEIIAVNDGSREDDELFQRKFLDRIAYYKTGNKGPAAARNFGIEKATGEFIAFLDSDDLWEPKKLEIQVQKMIKNQWTWSHTGYSLFKDADGSTIRLVDVLNFDDDVFLRCLISSPIATPCVMVRRDFLLANKAIRFSEQMRYGQDGLMWLNIARYKPLGVIPIPLSRVRMRGKNAALRARVYLKVKAQIWEFILSKVESGDDKYNRLHVTIKFAYKMCYLNNTLMQRLEKKLKLNNILSENVSRILYLPSYVVFKISKFVIHNMKQNV